MKPKMIVFMLLGASILLVGGAFAYVYFKVERYDEDQEIVNMPNPIVQCRSEADFEKYGLRLKTPADGENVSYSMIGGKIAEIRCEINGDEFCFRAAKNEDVQSLSGIYGEWVKQDVSGKADYHLVKGDPQYSVASWKAEGITYAVSTEDSVETLSAVIEDYLK